jgi:hypothetical protein
MRRTIIFAVISTLGCAGYSVEVVGSGDFVEVAPKLATSGWAWWLTHDFNSDVGTADKVDPARLQLRFLDAEIDPAVDFRFAESEVRDAASLAWARSSLLTLDITVFREGEPLKLGEEYTKVDIEGAPQLKFARDPLAPDAPMPGADRSIGSRFEYKLKFNELDTEAGGWVGGNLNLIVSEGSGDPSGVATGELAFVFRMPVVGERQAHCNEKTGFGANFEAYRDWPCEGLE